MIIFFAEDVEDRLRALRYSTIRWLTLAEALGADAGAIALARTVALGVLDDVGASFGLARLDIKTTLQIPTEREVSIGKRTV